MFCGSRGKREERQNEADTCNISRLHSKQGKLSNCTSQHQPKDQFWSGRGGETALQASILLTHYKKNHNCSTFKLIHTEIIFLLLIKFTFSEKTFSQGPHFRKHHTVIHWSLQSLSDHFHVLEDTSTHSIFEIDTTNLLDPEVFPPATK